ncbi:MAG: CoA pyrophosphatase [Clostridia bacterium]|jgi:8-oxo-dGTP pyrophosphatase MutT (NUDIX family)|nr:CoA pyrophosphatase [Clostridia bacterium]
MNRNYELAHIKNKLQQIDPETLPDEQSSLYAVLLPLCLHNGKLSVLFEVRAHELQRQPGEICFPGGQLERKDSSALAAALRETSEELGIARESIEVLGPLNILRTLYQNTIYPFAAFIRENTVFCPDNAEVAEIFFVPLDYLLENRPQISHVTVATDPGPDFPYHLIQGGEKYPWHQGKYPVYFYLYQEYVIWGMTARILYHFLENIRASGFPPSSR